VKAYNEFLNKQLIEVVDLINETASVHGLSVNILDKSFPQNIDADYHRLNVMIDSHSIIKKIFIG
jgi:hypothetical protein